MRRYPQCVAIGNKPKGGGVRLRILVPLIVLGVIVALSGVEYAHALTPIDTGPPLYLKSVDTVSKVCAGTADVRPRVTGPTESTVSLTGDGLSAHFVFPPPRDDTHIWLGYYEITAASTGDSIAVYNFDVPRSRIHEMTVPIDALGAISETPADESYTISPIYSTTNLSNSRLNQYRLIDHPKITPEIYLTWPSYLRGDVNPPAWVILSPGGVDTAITRSGQINPSVTRHITQPNVIECTTGSAQVSPSVEFRYTDGRGMDRGLADGAIMYIKSGTADPVLCKQGSVTHSHTAADYDSSAAAPTSVTYACTVGDITETIIVTVTPDNDKPTITAPPGVTHERGTVFPDDDVTCEDTTEGDITKYIVSNVTIPADATPGKHGISYTCVDSAGNQAIQQSRSITITIPGAGTLPVITASSPRFHFKLGDPVPDPGLVCEDGTLIITGDGITQDEMVDNTINGTKVVTYTCTDADSNPDTVTVTYLVDGTIPILSILTGTEQIELGSTFEQESPTCRDPYPRGPISDVTKGGVTNFLSALAGDKEATLLVTYDCKDLANNFAVQTTRTFEIRDTTNPASPTGTSPITITAGDILDLSAVVCPPDRGTPISLTNATTKDGNSIIKIDPDDPGEYVVIYKCKDTVNLESAPATQSITINPVPGSTTEPKFVTPPQTTITFKLGTTAPAHGLTCFDGTVDRTSTITPDVAVDISTHGKQPIVYTCTDADGKTDTVTITYDVDGEAPTFTGTAPSIHINDANNYAHGLTCDDDGTDATNNIVFNPLLSTLTTDAAHSVEISCSDGVENKVSQTVTITVDTIKPVITLTGGDTAITVGGSYTPPVPTCEDQTHGSITNIPESGDTVDPTTADTYTRLYDCADKAENDADQKSHTVVVSVPAPGSTTNPEFVTPPQTTITFKLGTTAPAHGLTCFDGTVDRTSTITPDVAVDITTHGEQPIVYTCTDADGNTDTVTITYDVDGEAPTFTGTAPSIHINDANNYAHTLTCDDDGTDATNNIVFNPLLSTLTTDAAHSVEISCSDGVENKVSQTVTITVDTIKPVITLTGGDTAITVGGSYTPPVPTCEDQTHGSITNIPESGDTVDPTTADTYTRLYDCADKAENDADQKSHTVTVTQAPTTPITPTAPVLVTGAPLYMKSVDETTTQCLADGPNTGTSVGSAKLLADGLFVSHTFSNDGFDGTRLLVSYIEVNAQSTGKSIAVYNFIVHDLVTFNATVPISALETITDNVHEEVYTTRPVISTIDTTLVGTPTARLFINHTELTSEIYKSLPVYLRGASEPTLVIAPGGVPTPIGGGLAFLVTINDPPIVTFCSTGSAQFPAPVIAPAEIQFNYTDSQGLIRQITDGDTIYIQPNTDDPVSCVQGANTLAHTAPAFDASVEDSIPVTYTCTDDPTKTISITVVIDGTKPIILRIGGEREQYQPNQYVDRGAICRDNVDDDRTLTATLPPDFDPAALFKFPNASYDCKDRAGNVANTVIRSLIISPSDQPDVVGPVISFPRNDPEVDHPVNTDYVDTEVVCTDDHTGVIDIIDIEGEVVTTQSGMYNLTYSCMDSSGNKAKDKIRTVTVVDPTKVPEITITGSPTFSIAQGEEYTDRGATCMVPPDGKVQDAEASGADFDRDEVGPHFITYTCEINGVPAVDVLRRGAVNLRPVITPPEGSLEVAGGVEVHSMLNERIVLPTCVAGTRTLDGSSITPTGTFDITREDSYPVTYDCISNGISSFPLTITYVVDSSPPTLALIGNDPDYTKTDSILRYSSVDPGTSCTDVLPGKFNSTVPDVNPTLEAEKTFTITYTCTDRAGNKDTITRQVIVDGTLPVIAQPTQSIIERIISGPTTVPDLGCTDNNPLTSTLATPNVTTVSTSVAKTHDIRYDCEDLAQNSAEPVFLKIRVAAASAPDPGSTTEPKFVTPPQTTITFKLGTTAPAHGLTCFDGTVDRTSTITPDVAVDITTHGKQPIVYTCTDADGKTDTVTITYDVDGEAPTFTGTAPSIHINDANNYAHTLTCDDDGTDATNNIVFNPLLSTLTTDAAHSVEISCSDGVENKVSQTVTITVDTIKPVITLTGGDTAITVGGSYTPPVPTCEDQTHGSITNIPESGDTVDPTTADTYTRLYDCADKAENDADQKSHTVVVSVPAPGSTTNPEFVTPPQTTITFKLGTTAPAHGLTCFDGTVDRTSTITPDVAVDITTHGEQPIVYTCTDADGNTDTVTITYDVDGEAPTFTGTAPSIHINDANNYAHTLTCDDDGTDATNNIVFNPLLSTLTTDAAHSVEISCSDGVENKVSQTVTITVDTIKPVITLTGGDTAITVGGSYTPPVPTCEDQTHGSITNIPESGDTVDPTTADTYTRLYDCADKAENDADQKSHTVTVTQAPTTPITPTAPVLVTGAPLYMKSVDETTTQCLADGPNTGTSVGSAKLLADGLFVSHTFSNDGFDGTRLLVSYIEVNAQSTGKSIAVYNFIVHDLVTFNATVPISALETITDNVHEEVYTTRPVISTIDTTLVGTPTARLFINHTELTSEIYKSLPVYLRGASEPTLVIAPGGVPTPIGGGLAFLVTINDPPIVTFCSTGSAQFPAPVIAPAEIQFNYTDSQGLIRQITDGDTIYIQPNTDDPVSCVQGANTLAHTAPAFDASVEDSIPVTYTCTDDPTKTISITVVIDGTKPIILRIGGEREQYQPNQYVDRGAICRDNVDDDRTLTATLPPDFDPAALFKFPNASYDCKDRAGNVANTVIRSLIISPSDQPDVVGPVISFPRNDPEVDHPVNTDYVDTEVVCTDDHTGVIDIIDIEGEVVTTQSGMYNLTYSCMDSSGNKAKDKIRTVTVVDPTKVPEITITGSPTFSIAQGEEYTDRGATCMVPPDGKVQDAEASGADFDRDEVGPHFITYTCEINGVPAVDVLRRGAVNLRPVITPPEGSLEVAGGVEVHSMLNERIVLPTCVAGTRTLDGSSITPTGTFDITREDSYPVTYDCISNGISSFPLTITYVVDSSPPTLALIGNDPDYTKTDSILRYSSVDPGTSCTDVLPGKFNSTVPDVNPTLEAEKTFTITYTCTDRAGNKDTITRQVIVDGTLPVIAQPTQSIIERIISGPTTVPDLGCTDNNPLTSTLATPNVTTVSTSVAKTHDIRYDCEDLAQNSAEPVFLKIRVAAASAPDPGSTTEPKFVTPPQTTITFKLGTTAPAHGLTCFDGTVDRTSTITPDVAVDITTHGKQPIVYTCTDADGKTDTVTITYDVDGEAPTFTGTAPSIHINDANNYAHTLTCDDDGTDATNNIVFNPLLSTLTTDAAHSVEISCSDGVENKVSQTVTITVDTIKPVITLTGGDTAITVGGSYTPPVPTCEDQTHGSITNIPESGDTVDPTTADTYTRLYDCADKAENDADQKSHTVVVSVPAPGSTTEPKFVTPPQTTITFKLGTTAPAHGLTCFDGTVDRTSTITPDVAVDITTHGKQPIVYTCTDADGKTDTVTITYDVDGEAPTFTGTAPSIHINDANNYAHTLTCDDDGTDATNNIVFNPLLSTLTTDAAHSVEISCSDGVENKVSQTVTITVDTIKPVITLTGGDTAITVGGSYTPPVPTCEDQTHGSITNIPESGDTVDPTTADTYTRLYDCADKAENDADQKSHTVVVSVPAPGSTTEPKFVTPPQTTITFKLGTTDPAHGLTCFDGTVDRTSTITPDVAVDISTHGKQPIVYTCTDADGKTDTVTITYDVDGEAPTFTGTAPSIHINDANNYAHTLTCDDDGTDATNNIVFNPLLSTLTTDAAHSVEISCSDGVENKVSQTVTITVDTIKPVITTDWRRHGNYSRWFIHPASSHMRGSDTRFNYQHTGERRHCRPDNCRHVHQIVRLCRQGRK